MSRTARNKPQVRKAKAWDMGPRVFLRSNLHLGNPRKARAKGKQQERQRVRIVFKDELQQQWQESVEAAIGTDKMPPCPACGGVMIDDSSFLVCGAKCTKCDFKVYEGNVS